ncbi:MAG: hypothetical protein IKA87_01965, partial [Lentisphaeria bacterium]|nr:hypothetical protein [Lentisphaeria bacterium]
MPFVFIVTVAAFLPAVSFKELISDDVFYHLNILSLQNSISRIFEPVLGLRTPLTSLSLYADMLLWGKEHFVSGSHFTNILLHALNGVLFFCLLRKLQWNGKTLSPAWAGITVLIFALHPQRVESVAWLCERKDTLSMA